MFNLCDNASLTIKASTYWMGLMIGCNQWDTTHAGGTLSLSGNSRFVFTGSNSNLTVGEAWTTNGGVRQHGAILMSGTSQLSCNEIFLAQQNTDTTGVLTIGDGASLVCNEIADSDGNGANAGGVGIITVSGHGSLTANSWLAPSNSDGCNGVLTIKGNGYVYTGDLQISWGGTGTVVVGDGTGNAVLSTPLCEVGAEYDDTAPAVVAKLYVNAGGTVRRRRSRVATTAALRVPRQPST